MYNFKNDIKGYFMPKKLILASTLLFSISLLSVFLTCSSMAKYSTNLKSSDVPTRRDAIIKVGQLGPKAVELTKQLLELAVSDPDLEVRRLSIEAIGYINPPLSIELVDAMVLCINDEDVHIRRATIIAIGNFSNVPPNLVTMLQKRLGDSDTLIRELAISVFEKIGKLGVRALVRGLSDPNTDMRLNSALVLGKLGPQAILALNELQRVEIEDESEDVKRAATDAIKYITAVISDSTTTE